VGRGGRSGEDEAVVFAVVIGSDFACGCVDDLVFAACREANWVHAFHFLLR